MPSESALVHTMLFSVDVHDLLFLQWQNLQVAGHRLVLQFLHLRRPIKHQGDGSSISLELLRQIPLHSLYPSFESIL